MQKSDNNQLKNIISKNYQLDEIVKIGNFIQGFSNEHTILATKNAKYFLKKHGQKFNERVSYFLEATSFFYKEGIPVIMPIKTKNNKLYFIYHDQYYSLYPYIVNLRTNQNNFSTQALNSSGQMLAKIHLAGKNYPKGKKKNFRHWNKDEFNKRFTKIMSVFKKKTNQDKFDKLFLEKLSTKYKFVQKNKLFFNDFKLKCDHLTHGDYHQRNIAFDVRKQVKYVFDFKSKLAPRVLELVRSVDLICFKNYGNIDYRKAKKFLTGYKSVYPIDQEELKQGIIAHHVKNFYQLWSEEEYYLNNNNPVGFLLESSIQRLKYSSQNLSLIIKELT